MMMYVGVVLLLIGFLIVSIAGLNICIAAFEKSMAIGFFVTFVPLVGLVFVFDNWSRTGKDFLMFLSGGILIALGCICIIGI